MVLKDMNGTATRDGGVALAGGVVIPARAVCVVESSERGDGCEEAGDLRTVEEGGIIRFLEYACTCGKSVRIECLYEAEAAPANSRPARRDPRSRRPHRPNYPKDRHRRHRP